MKTLFDAVAINGMSLKNRVIRSATVESAEDGQGRFAKTLIPIYTALANGGVGTIITGMAGVDGNSRVSPAMIRAYGEHYVPELRAVAEAMRAQGCNLVVQLSHCGQKATHIDGGGLPLGPSAVEGENGPAVKAMTHEDIFTVMTHFAEAAARSKEGGADAVQLHCAHGYLLSQFLSPYFNKRDDAYGGDITGRSRIVFGVYDAVRRAVGPRFPVWIKINGTDLVDGGLTAEDSRWVCERLAECGVGAIEISGGAAVNAASSSAQVVKSGADEGRFFEQAAALAAVIATPVISVCGYRTPEIMEEKLNAGAVTALSLCRPLICEPGLLNRWRGGDRAKSRCISCNKCFRPKDGKFGCQMFPDPAASHHQPEGVHA